MTNSSASLIRRARIQAGLSQSELARRARTSQPAIARYQGGHADPVLGTLKRLVEACGFELQVDFLDAKGQRQAAADAALARSVEDRLRTNDSFTALSAQLRRG